MQYPCLVPEFMCNTDIHIELERESIDVYGEAPEPVIIDKKCNYQDKAKTVFTAENKEIKLTGRAYIPGDIAPELPTLSGGTVTIFGVKRKLYQGTKARNPDNTVNFTLLEVE